MFRRELLVSLEKDPIIHVIAEADVPGHLGPVVAEHPPRVLCLDLTPPLGDPVDGVRRLREAMPLTSILVLVGPEDDPTEALLAGASGAVEKNTALGEAPAIIHALAAGHVYLDAPAARSLLDLATAEDGSEGAEVGRLSPAQTELLHQLASGRDPEELAAFFQSEASILYQRLWETLSALRSPGESEDQEAVSPDALSPTGISPILGASPMFPSESAVKEPISEEAADIEGADEAAIHEST